MINGMREGVHRKKTIFTIDLLAYVYVIRVINKAAYFMQLLHIESHFYVMLRVFIQQLLNNC